MRAWIAGMVTVALVVTVVLTLREVTAAGALRLIVTPSQGHAGDAIFLSGSGFVPGRPAPILLRCGSQQTRRLRTVTANSHGRFAGMQVRLSRGTKAGRCGLSAASSKAPAIRTRESLYTVVSPRRPLTRCAAQICLGIQAFLVRLRNGARGNIVISGWPGATVRVTVARTEVGAKYRVFRLNWRGVGAMTTSIAPGLIKGLRARVFVHARLGRVAGTGHARFHVMFGNR